jgi:hypothetical protein
MAFLWVLSMKGCGRFSKIYKKNSGGKKDKSKAKL